MNFVTVRDFRAKSGQIWKKLSNVNEMVITLNGKPVAILTPTSENKLEETLKAIRTARAIQAVESIQQKSVERGYDRTALEEINAEIAEIRKGSRKGKSR